VGGLQLTLTSLARPALQRSVVCFYEIRGVIRAPISNAELSGALAALPVTL
jgi:hypothetical protein